MKRITLAAAFATAASACVPHPRPVPVSAVTLPAMAPAAVRAVRDECVAFMDAYARDLRAGDRAAIAARYDRSGAWRMGAGGKTYETWDRIEAVYAGSEWTRPASFAWDQVSCEPLGPDAVLVAALFEWGEGEGRPPVVYSYTGLLIRQQGVLRIRLEDENPAPARR